MTSVTSDSNPHVLTEEQWWALQSPAVTPNTGLSHVLILEVNKSQCNTKLFFWLCLSNSPQSFSKACVSWLLSSAVKHCSSFPVFTSLQIPVELCISIKWQLGFLLCTQQSSPLVFFSSSHPPSPLSRPCLSSFC